MRRKWQTARKCLFTPPGAPPTTDAPPLPMEAEPREDWDSAAIAR